MVEVRTMDATEVKTSSPRVLVIGSGYWGRKLINRFLKLGAQVRAVDKDIVPLMSLATEYGIETGSLDDQLPWADAVAIATPIPTHGEIVRRCLTEKKHVLVEKPMCTDPGEAVQLAGMADELHLALITDLTFLYHPKLPTEVYSFIWTGHESRHREDGILWSWGPHPISILLSVRGKPDKVKGKLGTDFLDAYFTYENGPGVVVLLRWGNYRRGRIIVNSTGPVDLGDVTPNPEPLLLVCRAFLEQTKSPVRDRIGVETVEALSWIEKILGKGK